MGLRARPVGGQCVFFTLHETMKNKFTIQPRMNSRYRYRSDEEALRACMAA